MPLWALVSNGSARNRSGRGAARLQQTLHGKGRVLKDFIVRRRGGLIEAEVDGELIGLEVGQGHCYGFNNTATRIWSLIEEPKRFSELQSNLVAEYEVDPERCARELRALLDDLAASGLVAMEPLDA